MPAHQMKAAPLRSAMELVLFARTLKCQDCGHDGLLYSSDDDHRGAPSILGSVKCPICRKWTEIECPRDPEYGRPNDNLRVAPTDRPSQLLSADYFRTKARDALEFFTKAEQPDDVRLRAEEVVKFYVELRKFGTLQADEEANLQIGLHALMKSGVTLPADITRLVQR